MSAARFASLPRVSAWLLALTAGLSTGCANYYYGPPGQGELPGHSRQSGPGLGGLLPPPRPADVLQANEQAADALLERSGLDMRSTVLVATLVGVDRLNESSRLGRLFSEQIAGRLVQRGVRVSEVRLREGLVLQPGQGELLLSREAYEVSQVQQAHAVVVGTYAASPRQVYVNLKIVVPEGNRVLAAHNYALPMNEELRALLMAR